mgnify:CR=1 FL=1
MLTLLSIAIFIVALVQAIIGITINLLRIAYNHIKVINTKLKSKRQLKRLQSFKFELHPDLNKD